jgi:hypothetical protein
MDMKTILQNMDAAAAGEKPSAGAKNVNDMKSILEAIKSVEECGDMPMMASQEMNKGNPVTVNITASGKENVNDLMDLIKLAGGNTEQHIDMPMAHDAMHTDVDSHKSLSMSDMARLLNGEDEEGEVEEWANSPEDSAGDEDYQDHKHMTQDLSGGLNRAKPKGSERVKDPAIESIKTTLWAALQEKKATEGKYKSDAQRKAVHASKNEKKN